MVGTIRVAASHHTTVTRPRLDAVPVDAPAEARVGGRVHVSAFDPVRVLYQVCERRPVRRGRRERTAGVLPPVVVSHRGDHVRIAAVAPHAEHVAEVCELDLAL